MGIIPFPSQNPRKGDYYDPRRFCPSWCVDAHSADVENGGLHPEDGCEHGSLPLFEFETHIGTAAYSDKDNQVVLERMAFIDGPEGPDANFDGFRLYVGESDGSGAVLNREDLRRLIVELQAALDAS